MNKPDRLDIMVLSCVAIKFATIFLTAYFMIFAATITKASIENAVAVMEQNIMIHLLMRLNNVATVITVILGPAMMYAVYFVMKKYMGKERLYLLEFYVSFLVLATVGNFLNDLGGVIGLMIKAGLV